MGPHIDLETPTRSADLYIATNSEELAYLENRPLFTGDVLQLETGEIVALIQHPCAMRSGPDLLPKLLACNLSSNAQVPKKWSGSFKRMFFPDLNGTDCAIDFTDMRILTADEASRATRLAVLSMRGVNILVQRWLHHNSRVIVPTITIHEQTSGPFEEADLVGEVISDLVEGGHTAAQATAAIDKWLGEPHAPGGSSRRDLLVQTQARSAIRTSARQFVREQLAQ